MIVEDRTQIPIEWKLGAGLMTAHLLIALINLSPLIDSYFVASVIDVNAENTVHVWLSSALLLAIAGLFAGGGWVARQRGESSRSVAAWLVIAGGFAVLSVDETASLHELVGEKASSFLEIEWLPSLYTWVVVVAPIAAVAAVWLIRWFGRTFGWATTAGRLAVTAVALWMMVPVLEAVDPTLGGPRALVVLEESLETVGETMAIVALLIHFRSTGVRFQLSEG